MAAATMSKTVNSCPFGVRFYKLNSLNRSYHMLQGINTFIDTVQGAKSTFVKTFVQDKEVAKSLQSYVDTQTEFVKTAAKSTFDVSIKFAQDAAKFDVKKVFATK
jgi:hypothetical protein